MKSGPRALVAVLFTSLSAVAGEADVGSKDTERRRKTIKAEIERRKRIIQIALASLEKELGKDEPDRDHDLIRDMLHLLVELRAAEALDLFCEHIGYVDPRFDPSIGSLQPVELSYPIVHAIQSIGYPAKEVLLRHLAEARGQTNRWLLLICLVRAVGPETARVELERLGLGDLKIRLDEVYPYLRPSKPGTATDNRGDPDR